MERNFWDDDEQLAPPPPAALPGTAGGWDAGLPGMTGGIATTGLPSNGIRVPRNGLKGTFDGAPSAPDAPAPWSAPAVDDRLPPLPLPPASTFGRRLQAPAPDAASAQPPHPDDLRIQGLTADFHSVQTPEARQVTQGLLEQAHAGRAARVRAQAAAAGNTAAASELRGMAARAGARGDAHAQDTYLAEAQRVEGDLRAERGAGGIGNSGNAAPVPPPKRVDGRRGQPGGNDVYSVKQQRQDAISDFLFLTRKKGFSAADALAAVNPDLVIDNRNTPGNAARQTADAANDYLYLINHEGFDSRQAIESVLADPVESLSFKKHGGDMSAVKNHVSRLPIGVLRQLSAAGISFAAVRNSIGEYRDFGDSTPRGYSGDSKLTYNSRPAVFDDKPNDPTVVIATSADPKATSSPFPILHEIGHAYDYAFSVVGKDYLSRSPDFMAAYNADATSLGAYNLENHNPVYYYSAGTSMEPSGQEEGGNRYYRSETFAESFAHYYGQDKDYQASQPNLYSYFGQH